MIIAQPNSVTINAFESVIMECSFQSYGFVSIEWKKDERYSFPETASESILRNNNIVTSKLQINRAVGYYRGGYYCVAENIAGRVSSMIAELDVTGETLFVTGFMETVPNHTLEVTR